MRPAGCPRAPAGLTDWAAGTWTRNPSGGLASLSTRHQRTDQHFLLESRPSRLNRRGPRAGGLGPSPTHLSRCQHQSGPLRRLQPGMLSWPRLALAQMSRARCVICRIPVGSCGISCFLSARGRREAAMPAIPTAGLAPHSGTVLAVGIFGTRWFCRTYRRVSRDLGTKGWDGKNDKKRSSCSAAWSQKNMSYSPYQADDARYAR
jgi:hypothetical protein